MKVAIFGCLHGMLDDMFTEVSEYERQKNEKIELILVCGDCQTIRHPDDLQCLSVPPKYRKVGDFPDYYSGKKKVPKLTIFVGGNHECSNYLMTLPYGGWVCENMYFMGYSSVIRYKGFRIAGLSGIYNHDNCNKGRFERMPLDQSTIRSIYHVRRLDVLRLQLLQKRIDNNKIDMLLTHDWPVKIYDYGNKQQLLRFKPGFVKDVQSKFGLGNPLTRPLLFQLRPRRWFAAHLHCRFHATVKHDTTSDANPEAKTDFLCLDKIENKYKSKWVNYMEILDLEPLDKLKQDSVDEELHHDIEWLTILRKTAELEKYTPRNIYCPKLDEPSGQALFPTDEDIEETQKMLNKLGGLRIERNFRMVEPVIYDRPNKVQPSLDSQRQISHSNYQTDQLCMKLGLKVPDNLRTLEQLDEPEVVPAKPTTSVQIKKEEEPILWV